MRRCLAVLALTACLLSIARGQPAVKPVKSRDNPEKLRYEAGDSNRKLTFAAQEHHKVYDMLRQSGLEWTIVCPTYLPDGAEAGNYRTERDLLPLEGKKISVGDAAAFAYNELLENENSGFRVGISY